MARTAEEIRAKIAELTAARAKTQARNGYRHYSERIDGLKGELLLLEAARLREEEQEKKMEQWIFEGYWL